MKWTKEKPNVEGFYWQKIGKQIDVTEVDSECGELKYWDRDDLGWYRLESFEGYWSSCPIQEPKD